MDTITSKQGLTKAKSNSDIDDVDQLSPVLKEQLRSLEEIFTVDAAKLKEISKRFEEELQEGTFPDTFLSMASWQS